MNALPAGSRCCSDSGRRFAIGQIGPQVIGFARLAPNLVKGQLSMPSWAMTRYDSSWTSPFLVELSCNYSRPYSFEPMIPQEENPPDVGKSANLGVHLY